MKKRYFIGGTLAVMTEKLPANKSMVSRAIRNSTEMRFLK